jgi:hypothetical protein
MREERGVAGSQPVRKAVHMEPINFRDLTPYLTYGRTLSKCRKKTDLREKE